MNPARQPYHARLDGEFLERLLDEHLRDPFTLANKFAVSGGPPLVTELLRLARLGAEAERESSVDPSTNNALVVQAMASRWARLVGTP